MIIYKIILIRNKEDIKNVLKGIGIRITGILIPLVLFAIYFSINNIWGEFFNYCIFGIKEFDNKIAYTKLFEEELIIKILAILAPLILIYMLYIYFKTRKKQSEYNINIFTIVPFTIAGIFVMYPIAEKGHFLIGIYPIILVLIYIFSKCSKRYIKKEKIKIFIKSLIEMFVITSSVAVIIFLSIPSLCEYTTGTRKSQLNHFEFIPMEKELEERINEVANFIEKQDKYVYILDSEAAIYKISWDRYNKDYDMFLKGNFGKNGNKKIIEQIQKNEEGIYLIKNNQHPRNWQSPEEIVKYVLENLKKTGEISIYDIYEK